MSSPAAFHRDPSVEVLECNECKLESPSHMPDSPRRYQRASDFSGLHPDVSSFTISGATGRSLFHELRKSRKDHLPTQSQDNKSRSPYPPTLHLPSSVANSAIDHRSERRRIPEGQLCRPPALDLDPCAVSDEASGSAEPRRVPEHAISATCTDANLLEYTQSCANGFGTSQLQQLFNPDVFDRTDNPESISSYDSGTEGAVAIISVPGRRDGLDRDSPASVDVYHGDGSSFDHQHGDGFVSAGATPTIGPKSPSHQGASDSARQQRRRFRNSSAARRHIVVKTRSGQRHSSDDAVTP